jgi:predicted permease
MNLPVLVVGAVVFVGVGLAVAFLGERGLGGVMIGAGIGLVVMWAYEMLAIEAPSDTPEQQPLQLDRPADIVKRLLQWVDINKGAMPTFALPNSWADMVNADLKTAADEITRLRHDTPSEQP